MEVPGGIVLALRVADEGDNSWGHLVEPNLVGGRADGWGAGNRKINDRSLL